MHRVYGHRTRPEKGSRKSKYHSRRNLYKLQPIWRSLCCCLRLLSTFARVSALMGDILGPFGTLRSISRRSQLSRSK
ncbi:uncharacterized protein BJX67DRAFT_354548 [Aspergillus lucknowensis]|uniref:Uncharacterized protein n=1 Tax=Aspergillus lucknowensis TaxID=176173 RepID=A0ABR4LQ52_9EURO